MVLKSKMVKFRISALILASFFYSCGQNQELIEVQIPERASFIEPKAEYPDPSAIKTTQGPFEMKGLPYKYDEIAELIKPEALLVHYGKIHLRYANALNSQVHNTAFEKDSISLIVKKLDGTPSELQHKVGGYYNHLIYWNSIAKTTDSKPTEELTRAINNSFGNIDELKKQLKSKAKSLTGSGWVWLIDTNGTLAVITTKDNELPTSNKTGQSTALLAIDLWEHAYMQTFPDDLNGYLDKIVNQLNWEYASKKYSANNATL